MMISVAMMIYLMLFSCGNLYIGVVLYLFTFFLLLVGFDLLGMDFIKGDLYGMLGLDYISYYMLLLLMWVCSLVLILYKGKMLSILVLSIILSIYFVFVSLDMLFMFICFEFSMLPMFIMIMFMGSMKERYVAGLYMFIYTMVGSLPSLLLMMTVSKVVGGLSMSFMMYNFFSLDEWVVFIIIVMFLIKVPLFILHIWLPKAHVEAPVYGSMILASVMLKMGGYGIIRCYDIMLINIEIMDFFFCLCLVGSLFIGYMCLYQVDLKVLVAYSSVVHMAMMLAGYFTGSEIGFIGGVIMMISHGVCSSGMFYLVNEIYTITGSRLMIFNKGLGGCAPILSMIWLLMLIMNLGVPPCFGIVGELMLLSSCIMNMFSVFLMLFFIIFFISCFVINMYALLVGGMFMYNSVSIKVVSYYGSFMHLIPLNLFIFFMVNCF